ncbi:MAG TPA: hypothetical protein VF432_24010 [Thermoanaerobaculia bacterium]
MRRYYDWDMNFMQTATGKHVLLWQADESNWDLSNTGPHGDELRFVTNTYNWITTQRNSLGTDAEVNISNRDDKRNVHYVFVPEALLRLPDPLKLRDVPPFRVALLTIGQQRHSSVAFRSGVTDPVWSAEAIRLRFVFARLSR